MTHEALFALAIALSGYESLCVERPDACSVIPIVVRASDAQLGTAKGGHVLHARPDQVVVASRYEPGSHAYNSILVHEFTHVLQLRSQRWRGLTVCQKALREREAYMAQLAYLERYSLTLRNPMAVPDELDRRCEASRSAGLIKE